jgi:hypothetical protein
MAITELHEVVLAATDVTDDYRVRLRTVRRKLDLNPNQARKLAAELIAAADEAAAAWGQDHPAFVASLISPSAAQALLLDNLPSCPDCMDGHHGACIGSAFVEGDGPDLVEVDCGCAKIDHKVVGA